MDEEREAPIDELESASDAKDEDLGDGNSGSGIKPTIPTMGSAT